jgi:hypothetical protein
MFFLPKNVRATDPNGPAGAGDDADSEGFAPVFVH